MSKTVDIEGTIIQNFPEELSFLIPVLTQINKTAAEQLAAGNYVLALSSGVKIAAGSATPVAGTTDVTTGLATVTHAVVALKGDPTLTHMYSTVVLGGTAGHITLKHWKPTANNDVTPAAASTPWGDVWWIAIGT